MVQILREATHQTQQLDINRYIFIDRLLTNNCARAGATAEPSSEVRCTYADPAAFANKPVSVTHTQPFLATMMTPKRTRTYNNDRRMRRERAIEKERVRVEKERERERLSNIHCTQHALGRAHPPPPHHALGKTSRERLELTETHLG